MENMKFITSKSIDVNYFKKEEFQLHDSIESIVKDNLNSKNLYILEVEIEENPFNKFMLKCNLASRKGRFKNHYVDKNGISVKRKDLLKFRNGNNIYISRSVSASG